MAINVKGTSKASIAAMAAKNAEIKARQDAERIAEIEAFLAQARAENARLKAAVQRDVVAAKVTTKGQVSVGGLSGWPVTMYAADWTKLAAFVKSGALDTFMAEHKDELTVRPPAGTRAA